VLVPLSKPNCNQCARSTLTWKKVGNSSSEGTTERQELDLHLQSVTMLPICQLEHNGSICSTPITLNKFLTYAPHRSPYHQRPNQQVRGAKQNPPS
jgi:hypothetical protein